MTKTFVLGERSHQVSVTAREGRTVVSTPCGELVLTYEQPSPNELLIKMDGRTIRAFVAGDRHEVHVHVGAGTFSFRVVDLRDGTAPGAGTQPVQTEIVAQMPGLVTKIHVREGDRLEKDGPIIVLESMKMENTQVARQPCVIRKINVRERQQVEAGAVLVELEPV